MYLVVCNSQDLRFCFDTVVACLSNIPLLQDLDKRNVSYSYARLDDDKLARYL